MRSFRKRDGAFGAAACAWLATPILIAGCASGNAIDQTSVRAAPLAPAYTESAELSQAGRQKTRNDAVAAPDASPWDDYGSRGSSEIAAVTPAPVETSLIPEMIEQAPTPRVRSLPQVEALYVATRMMVNRLPPLHFAPSAEPALFDQTASNPDAEESDAPSEEYVLAEFQTDESNSVVESEVRLLPEVSLAEPGPMVSSDKPKTSRLASDQPTRRVQITAVRPIEEAERTLQ